MSDLQVLNAVVNSLESIPIPVNQIETIGIPIYNASMTLKNLIQDVLNRSAKNPDQQEEQPASEETPAENESK